MTYRVPRICNNDHFNDGVLRQQHHILMGQKIVGRGSTAEDLKQSRDGRRLKGDPVNIEEWQVVLIMIALIHL